MTDLIKLAERCETEAGSRELDARLHMVRFPDCEVMTDPGGYHKERPVRHSQALELLKRWQDTFENFADLISAQGYTTSLDAALALVDDDWAHKVMRDAVSAVGRKFDLHIDTWPGDASYQHELAKAICAAALRARSGEW